ncbi:MULTISPECIES: sugar phosphate isomerase/epimerase family protein [Actinosynnema]|uniref:Sugar phosphate isomerase n=1 Tax=Actinosynnema pretiosum TaxID=42197 RepID=A0A290Z549_9PSEU|nr:sugar phosphate isomerase/epimerase family protein [Actinosynnema pretiosum]ATE54171.1 sugar phosphate isomerase [Actinosynnema pretiosum]
MSIGLSTYAFFWQLSSRVEKPLTLVEVVGKTAELGVGLLQICDHPAIEDFDAEQLRALRAAGDAAGVAFELGTRGLRPEHLRRYLDIADALGAKVLRSMVNTADHRPTPDEALADLRAIAPELAERGVDLALETYEQVSTAALVELVEGVDHPRVGICLDPANTVAALEQPGAVVDRCAKHVLNVHSKDFAFTRSEGWVGFQLAGALMGTGLLDYDHLLDRVRPDERGVNQIVEHWLPWQGDEDTTRKTEQLWTAHSVDYLRSTRP